MTRALAVALVALSMPAWAMLAAGETPPNLPGGPIQKFFVQDVRVDGVPVYHEEWRIWDGRIWIPLMSDEGQWRAFGLKPAPSQAPSRPRAWPKPGHYKRDLE